MFTAAYYTPFFKEVWEKKPEIEQAFHLEEPIVDSSLQSNEKLLSTINSNNYQLKLATSRNGG